MEPIPPPPPPPPPHLSHFVVVSMPFVGPSPHLYLPPIPHSVPPPPLTFPGQPPPAGIIYIPHLSNRDQRQPPSHHDYIPPRRQGPARGPKPPPRYQTPKMPPPGRANTLSPAASTAEWETNTDLPILSSSSSSSSGSDTPSRAAPIGISVSNSYDFDNEDLAAQRAMREQQADEEEQERIQSLKNEPQRVSRAMSNPTILPSTQNVGERRERKGRVANRLRRRRPHRSTSRPASPKTQESSASLLRADVNWSAVGTVGSAGDGYDSDAEDGSGENGEGSVKSIDSGEMMRLRRRFYGNTGQKKRDEGQTSAQGVA